MTKIQLVDNASGGKDVVVHGQFNLGKLYEQDTDGRTFIASMGVSVVKEALKAVLDQDVPSHKRGDWSVTLNEYVKLCVLEQLGVTSHPPIRQEDGTIQGFKEYDVLNPVTEDGTPIRLIDQALSDVRQGAYDQTELTFVLEMARTYMLGTMK